MRGDSLAIVLAAVSGAMLVGLLQPQPLAADIELAGTFCQPREDEHDVVYEAHTYLARSAYEASCPLIATDMQSEAYLATSLVEVNVQDGSASDVVMTSICRDYSSSKVARWCGATGSTGATWVGWAVISLPAPAVSSTAENVYFVDAHLASSSRIHSYRAYVP
ncbi:MAG: hypothetical protein AB7S26_39750 [Sandaracinaceae bacterium]